jgi:4-hydroxyphenylacetate 3-hydroxylase, reductase component
MSPVDRRDFRRCLSQFATGVTVMTAAEDGTRAGVTANSFSSLSLDPPLILWSLAESARSFSLFARAAHFGVSVLAVDQVAISQRFASAEQDKFKDVAWVAGTTGVPLVEGAVAHIECARAWDYEGGDHRIFVGRVESYRYSDGEPLLFVQGRYGVARDHPAVQAGGSANTSQPLGPTDVSFLSLMFQAYQSVAAGFEAHRAEEGLSRSQVRVMTGLSESPGISLDELARTKYLSRRDADDAVSWLREASLVSEDAQGLLALTDRGWARLEVINRRWRDYEEGQLRNIPRADVERAKDFFQRLILRGAAP